MRIVTSGLLASVSVKALIVFYGTFRGAVSPVPELMFVGIRLFDQ